MQVDTNKSDKKMGFPAPSCTVYHPRPKNTVHGHIFTVRPTIQVNQMNGKNALFALNIISNELCPVRIIIGAPTLSISVFLYIPPSLGYGQQTQIKHNFYCDCSQSSYN